MKAIVITEHGGPEVLKLQDVPTPLPAKGEVRIRVHATAVNRADLLQRMGSYPAPADVPSNIPGLEFSGAVDALGEGVTGVGLGDRVLGLVGGGAYAEYIVVPARTVAKIPTGISYTDAAALPEACITAYDGMVTQGRLCAGETVLVHAVGSGVGTAAIQIARAIGADAIGTARTEAKLNRCVPLGMRAGIVVTGSQFSAAVLKETDNRGVDVVLDLVGGPYVPEEVGCMALQGRIILVGLLAGARAHVDLGAVLRKRLQIVGTVLRSRPLEEKIAVMRAFETHVIPLVRDGRVKAIVDRVFSLEEAATAHAHVATNENFGKVVLTVAN